MTTGSTGAKTIESANSDAPVDPNAAPVVAVFDVSGEARPTVALVDL